MCRKKTHTQKGIKNGAYFTEINNSSDISISGNYFVVKASDLGDTMWTKEDGMSSINKKNTSQQGNNKEFHELTTTSIGSILIPAQNTHHREVLSWNTFGIIQRKTVAGSIF
jgi:hypothetical protein